MRSRSVFAICLLLLGITAASGAESAIGSVKEVSGTAVLITDGVRRPAALGGSVYQDDTMETGADGALGVLLTDDTRLSLGADTSMTIDEYVFASESEGGSFFSRLARGSLEFVSGLIAKSSTESAAIETPVATIGIRGTKLLVELTWEEE